MATLHRSIFRFSMSSRDYGLSAADLTEISQALDISDALAEQIGENEQRNLRIAQRLLELAERHSRILVFAASVDNALLLASVCRGRRAQSGCSYRE